MIDQMLTQIKPQFGSHMGYGSSYTKLNSENDNVAGGGLLFLGYLAGAAGWYIISGCVSICYEVVTLPVPHETKRSIKENITDFMRSISPFK